jgi:hypothetical protein
MWMIVFMMNYLHTNFAIGKNLQYNEAPGADFRKLFGLMIFPISKYDLIILLPCNSLFAAS